MAKPSSKEATIAIVSDIHYASPAEQARGCTELKIITQPLVRGLVKAYRHFLWRRNPFEYNHLVDEFVTRAQDADWIIANGDYSCDTAFVGVCDDASFHSAEVCLAKLRAPFGERFYATLGDHELGKFSLFGRQGGLRLASWERARRELSLPPLWEFRVGHYSLIGIASTVVALPAFESELLPEERDQWHEVRNDYMRGLRETFRRIGSQNRVVLFCHDPTALPFLWRDEAIRGRLNQLEATVIGHLHSPLFLWKAKLLAGMPTIACLGPSIRRMSAALREGKLWKHFRVRLCPSLGGIQLLNDGGYLNLTLQRDAERPLRFAFVPMPTRPRSRALSPEADKP